MVNLLDEKLHNIKSLSFQELETLCSDIRKFLIQSNSKTGGHIGANLGVVELTVALHKVFVSPIDSFIFDTGHIGYTHKLITGRKELFSSLNSFGGMNRFITPDESEHDLIEMSHAGTSLSIGMGLALSKKMAKDNSTTISVIGDGSLAEGIALEALNHISTCEINHLIIINDNGFAISPGTGAIYEHLNSEKLSSTTEANFFENLGYDYSGPFDGHNLSELISSFESFKSCGGVKIIHIKTEKGKGLDAAKNNPIRMHFSNPFEIETGQALQQSNAKPIASYATDSLLDAIKDDKSIVAITAGTKYATDLDRVAKEFPQNCIDPGMSEQHAVSMAVGMTLKNYYPILNYQSTFMQRAYDQLIHDVAYTNRPLMILLARSGFAGYDNPTHHGIYDFSYLKGIPNLRIIYPANCIRLSNIISNEIKKKSGPVIICYPYGFEDEFDFEQQNMSGSRLLITTGNLAGYYKKYQKEKNIGDIDIFALEQISPIDIEAMELLLSKYKSVLLAEESVHRGGLAESLASIIVHNDLKIKFDNISLKNAFYPGGTSDELRGLAGLTPEIVFEKLQGL